MASITFSEDGGMRLLLRALAAGFTICDKWRASLGDCLPMTTTTLAEPSSPIVRKRAEATRIRLIAEHLPPLLAVQVRRDAAALEIEADGLERRRSVEPS